MELSHAPAEHHGKVNLPIPENLVIAWPYTDRLQSVRITGTPVFTLTLSSYFGSPGENWLHINVVINWQLSKQGIRWPVSPDRTAGSSLDLPFWSYPPTNYQLLMIAGSSLFLSMIHIKYIVFMSLWTRTIRIVISNWPRTQKFSQFFWKLQAGKTFTMVTRWSRSTSNFYALIGQNLTGEFMWKIYTATWNLFSLTAEADRVLNVGKRGECIGTLGNFYIYWGHIMESYMRY